MSKTVYMEPSSPSLCTSNERFVCAALDSAEADFDLDAEADFDPEPMESESLLYDLEPAQPAQNNMISNDSMVSSKLDGTTFWRPQHSYYDKDRKQSDGNPDPGRDKGKETYGKGNLGKKQSDGNPDPGREKGKEIFGKGNLGKKQAKLDDKKSKNSKSVTLADPGNLPSSSQSSREARVNQRSETAGGPLLASLDTPGTLPGTKADRFRIFASASKYVAQLGICKAKIAQAYDAMNCFQGLINIHGNSSSGSRDNYGRQLIVSSGSSGSGGPLDEPRDNDNIDKF